MLRATIAFFALAIPTSGLIADDKPVPDVMTDSVAPYFPGKERARFLAASGVDSELNEAEATAGTAHAKGTHMTDSLRK